MKENFTSQLPEQFAQNTLDLCGEKGKLWLNDLPRIVNEIEKNWSLKVEKPFQNLSYNYVAPCVSLDGEKAVLKIALPLDKPEIFNEARFLEIADGKGAVKFLKLDENNRAILLERLTPGANLKEIFRGNELKAVEIVAKLMRQIVKKPPPNSIFIRLEDWFKGFEKAEKTDFPKRFIYKARDFYKELSFDSKQKFLLHGDLHHENILSATREEFLAIDPKGVVGEIGYEIAVFLNNHLWWLAVEPNVRKTLNDAVNEFSKTFEIEPKNLRKWAFAQIVLSAWWTFEDNGKNWESELAFAEIWEV